LPDNRQGLLRVYLLYSAGDVPVLKGIQRVSRPGLRRYFDAETVRQSTFNQRGMTVVSTSSGVMTNFEAAQKGVGGEVLLRCW
jgi:small subunit ribosomal protein S8